MTKLRVKIITKPAFISFHFITEKWIKYMNLRDDVQASMYYVGDPVEKTDVTVLHEAVMMLNTFKPDKERDGLIVCADVSDTDRVSDKMAKTLNESCDVIITPTEFSAWGLRRGGVDLPIHVVPHGTDLPFIENKEKKIGFYVSTTNEQFVRKGSYISLEVASRIEYPKVIKVFPDYMGYKIPNAEIIGKVDNMADEFYKKVSIYVLPILGGAFELTALEALSTGSIVIATDHPIFAELPIIPIKSKYVPHLTLSPTLLEYHVGGGYEPLVDDTVEKINYVWNNFEKEQKKLKKYLNGLKKIYSWDNVAQKMLEIFLSYV